MGVADADDAANSACSRNPAGIVAGKRDEVTLQRFVEAALWIGRTGAPWRDLPDDLPLAQRLPSFPSLVGARLVEPGVRGAAPGRACGRAGAAGQHHMLCETRSVCAGAHRAASGAARSNAEAECLGRSRGGLCSKLHVCADGAGRILRLVPSPGQHSDLRYAPALLSSRKSFCDFAGIPARDAALDRGYVSARLRAAFAADGCAVHTPPKLGMVDPPFWDKAIYAANASRFGEPSATTSRTCSRS